MFMDNSLMELGAAADVDKVIEAANMVGASEIVLPDVFTNREATQKILDQTFERILSGDCNVSNGISTVNKFMVVPQGESLGEWFECYEYLMTRWGKHFHSIGIPKVTHTFKTQNFRFGRVQLASILESSGMVSSTHEYHALGCWDNPFEIESLSKFRWIRGIDTVLPVLAGRLGIAFDPDRGMMFDRPKVSLSLCEFDDPNPVITGHNVSCMLRWANAH